MINLKRRKRLTTIVIVFMITFLTGTAFALETGVLEIDGAVIVNVAAPDELYVIWSAAETGAPLAGSLDSTSSASIVNVGGRTAQRIVWDIEFDVAPTNGTSFAILTATATNNATLPASVTMEQPIWSDALLANELGLDVFILQSATFGTLMPGASATVIIEVEWNGNTLSTMPVGGHVLSLSIDFAYVPVSS